MNKDKEQLLELVRQYSSRIIKAKEFEPGVDDVPVSGAMITAEDITAVVSCVLDGWFTEGKISAEFCKQLAHWTGTRHVSLCNSGSSANLLALTALAHRQPGNRTKANLVITCATGFPTTVSAIYHAGLTPLFVDSAGYHKLNANDGTVLEALERKDVIGVILAHTLGFPFRADLIRRRCDELGKFFVEDCCLARGTKVKTISGDMNIEEIEAGDFVLTRNGYKRVIESRQTGIKEVIKRFGITATPDHPIITKFGVKRLDALKASDIIYVWNEKRSFIEERSIIDTRTPTEGKEEFTSGGTRSLLHSPFIGKSGSTITVKYQTDFMSIIKTETHSIMTSQILGLSPHQIMLKNTSKRLEGSKLPLETYNLLETKLQSGIEAKKEEKFIARLENSLGKTVHNIYRFAKFAGNLIKLISLSDQKIALENAKIKVAVYNLLVEDSHEYFANNVLVHNCDALGARVQDEPVGRFGHASTLSFFPAHHITTGEGGAVCTNDGRLHKLINSYRDWGRDCWCAPGEQDTCNKRFGWNLGTLPEGWDHKYTFTNIGYNLRMTEMQAALGLSQIKHLDRFNETRRWNYASYNWMLPHSDHLWNGLGGDTKYYSPFGYPITVTSETFTRKELVAFLEDRKIRTRPVFGGNLTRHPAFRKMYYEQFGSLENSDYIMDRTFWVGLQPNLHSVQLQYVIESFWDFFRERGLS